MCVFRSLALAGLVAAAQAREDPYGPRGLQDELKELPRAPYVPWRMFSGYIDVSAPEEPAGSRQMFYWFVESQSSPPDDPLLLWTNGGPGCSGFLGLLSENGPFRALEGGRLELNAHAWNKVANMVFIEQPVGVGFSTTDVDIQYGDAQAAADNLRFVLGFRDRFQLYSSSDFYLTGESYAGHYLPTLAAAIVQSGQVPQFRGIFLGNPLVWWKYRNYGQYAAGWGHQLLPRPLWQAYQEKGCQDVFFTPDEITRIAKEARGNGSAASNATATLESYLECTYVTDQMDGIMDNLDLYALDFPKCLTSEQAGRQERWMLRQAIERARGPRLPGDASKPEPESEYLPCASDHVSDYLNSADVREAIGVASDANWTGCRLDFLYRWNQTDLYGDVTPVWRELIDLGKFRIMIYSGDDDAFVATQATQEFIWVGLQLSPAERYWEPWSVDRQVAGFWTDFRTPGDGSFSLVTVHGAGHMVPQTQPARSFALLERFLHIQASPDIYGPGALQDEVKYLPRAPHVPWRMFSGYIDVSGPGEQAGSRQMFYWFVESQSSPRNDPLLLWTNGGPGCSGLIGFLSENGPFRAVEGGRLELNAFSWNKVANMVFIEQPVGVGFSTTEIDIAYGDAEAAADNLRFILGFRERFQRYASSDFYLTAESYGGHFLPTLAAAIEQSGQVPQFRGIFLGNPWIWEKYSTYGQYGTGWGHQILPRPLWQAYQEKGCKDVYYTLSQILRLEEEANDNTSDSFAEAKVLLQEILRCGLITLQMNKIMNNLDLYALDFPKCLTSEHVGRQERWVLFQAVRQARGHLQRHAMEPEPEYLPCSANFVADYLNSADVQEAIGVAAGANWSECASHTVRFRWNLTDFQGDVTPVWKELIDLGKLRLMIYSGDDDSIVATLATQEFIWGGLQLSPAARYWEPWLVDGQVAGFWTDFQTPGSGSFSLVTVHGAGHMVPATQPARSLALLERFLGIQAGSQFVV